MNAKIYIHSKDQFLDLSGRMGYKTYLGERFECQITLNEIIQKEYKNVKNALAMSSKDKTCSYDIYDDCIYEKVAKIMKDNTDQHCTVPWIRDDKRICTNSKDINTTFWIGWNRITNQEKDCLSPCHTTIVTVGAKNFEKLSDRNYSQVYLYFPPRVTKSEEHYLYPFLKLVGQIGGYLGLYRILLWALELCRFKKLKGFKKTKTDDSLNDNAGTTKNRLISLSALALESI